MESRGYGDELNVIGRGKKRFTVICIIKFWYLGFVLLLLVLIYLVIKIIRWISK